MSECSSEIVRFKANHFENQSKRKAIYLKDLKEEKYMNSMFIVWRNKLNDRLSDLSVSELNSNFSSDLAFDEDLHQYNCILRPKNRHYELMLNGNDDHLSDLCMEVKIITKPVQRNIIEINNRQKLSLNKLVLSISLSNVVLTYDRNLKLFLNILKTFKCDHQNLQRIFKNMHYPQKKIKISDFEKCSIENTQKEFHDFEMKSIATVSSGKRLEDFQKFDPPSPVIKLIDDYEWKQKCQKAPQPLPRDIVIIPPAPIRNRQENIYQPIWTFQTIGYAQESDPADYDGDIYYESSDFYEEIDIHEWEVAEEFSYTTDLKEEVQDGISDRPFVDPYQTVSILHNTDDPKHNRMIYNSDNGAPKNYFNNIVHYVEEKRINVQRSSFFDDDQMIDSVRAWHKMLKTIDYLEDEEDINLYIDDIVITKTFSTGHHLDQYQFNLNLSSGKNGQSIENLKANISESEINRKDVGFLGKLQSGRVDINKGSFWLAAGAKGKDNFETFSQLNFDSGEPPSVTRKPIGHQTYGVTLDELEKDEQNPSIPKFVVECIRIIEQTENIQTSGIYRASGKKESIDKVKKRMDEKSKKGSKYTFLKVEDVHTITGALKQFFRELKTELIPIQLVHNLPNDLEIDRNVAAIKHEINKINKETKTTLKYLLQHLRRVDENSEYNLMTASNLSIVWGACLFTASVIDTDTFETSELIKKNTLVKILIQSYEEIFNAD